MRSAQALYKKALDLAKVDHSSNEVLALLHAADGKGSAEAAYALGTWYLFGKHVPKDHAKAIGYLTRSAEHGIPHAAFDLAVCYEKGAGVAKNTRRAFRWYLQAALLGDKDARYEVGRCFYHGIGVARNEEEAALWVSASKASSPMRSTLSFWPKDLKAVRLAVAKKRTAIPVQRQPAKKRVAQDV